MLQTFEIPRARWASFLGLLAKRAAERPVRLEVVGRSLGDQEMGHLLPLRGIGYETKGSERGDVTILVGDDRAPMDHRVLDAVRIYVANNDVGEMEWLSIEERGGGRTLVHFEHLPALPAEPGAPA